ncbi:MAG TPA: FAD-dependent oxidoreductase [Candidatus Limnocylindrales bacterium]|nr:FAD-dependent oxidoreductase [Candidatus Limnocylindrales bacterium]
MVAPEHLANRDLDVASALPAVALPAAARIVVVGGGIVGASIAYHLALAGETDVVIVERGRLTNGTTWHAAGLVSQVRSTHALTELSRINVETYEREARETGIDPGFRRVGSLTVARTAERFHEIRRPVSIARDAALPSEIVDRDRIRELWPDAVVDDLVGGVFFPDDGTINPGVAALALARAAVDRGVGYVPDTTVTGFRRAADGQRVTGITTSAGDVDAEVIVLAAGLWTSELARLADASIALYPAEHVWVMTEETPAATEDLPFLRDLDGYLYVRHHGGRFVIGAFEPNGKPWAPSRVPTDGFVELGPDWDHFAPVLAAARGRVPALVDLGFRQYLRGPESFTPDANFQLGFVPEVPGLFVAAGLNSQGIIFGPGVGRAGAEWILAGHMTMDLVEVDVARMGRWASQRRWLHERTVESLGGLYAMHWPGKQPYTARGLRRLSLDGAYRAAGAAMGQVGGWERPLWFEPGAGEDGPTFGYSYTDPSWFPAVGEEVRATREGVALYDLTTYAKFEVAGPGALSGLQRLVTSDVDVPPGRVVYTILADERGGILMDPTITRLADERFLVLAPTVAQRRTEGLLRAGLPPDAVVTDVTSAWSTLHIAGPRSRELLARLTDSDVSAEAWPFREARSIEVGRTHVLALRVSFTGELGWELLVPTEFVADLYEHVVAAGGDRGLRHAGAFAFEAARLERGFRSWGHDMGPLDDPFAAGLGFTVSRRKAADYVGRSALERLRDVPDAERPRLLVSLHAPSAVLWHGESVLRGTERAAFVTSASIAPTLGGSVALALVRGELDGDDWCVEIGGDAFPCLVSRDPFYDPRGGRLRS